MRIRTKTLVVVGLTMFIMFAAIFGAADVVLTTRYREIEDRTVVSNAEKVAESLDDEVRRVDDNVSIWAARADTYRALESGDIRALSVDFGVDTLSRQNINFAILLDKSGHAVYAQFVDLDIEAAEDPSPLLVGEIEAATELRRPGDPRGVVRGIMRLSGGAAIISARSVTSADQYVAPNGTLVMGRYIDESALERISDMTGFRVTALAPPAKVPRAAVHTDATNSPFDAAWWTPHDTRTLRAYALVNGIAGEPAVVLRADIDREVRAQFVSAIIYAGVSLLLLAGTATAAMFVLIDRVVLTRLEGLSSEVKAIGLAGDSSARVSGEGADELGQLASRVNGMLTSLEAAEDEIRSARDELEQRVERRTHQLNLSEARHRELVERLADAVISVDLDGYVTRVNQRAVDLTGKKREELVGARFVDLMTVGSGDGLGKRVREPGELGGSWTVEGFLDSAENNPVPVEIRAAPFADTAGEVVGTQWIARDITDRRKFEQELLHLATHDYLTNLANRRAFEDELELELAEAMRAGHQGAVLWLDLDDFKDINDTLGHGAGDEMLVMLAGQLERNVRAGNLLARVGGDEFAVLMPRVEGDDARVAAERILQAISSFTYAIAGRSVRMGASVGVVFFPEHGVTVPEVLSNADAAMYSAKARGRSTVHISATHEQERRLRSARLVWTERITSALEDNDFVVFQQPILDLRADQVTRHELLIRMAGEDGVIHPPSDFLPTAERLGLINEIDRWMLREAVAILKMDSDHLRAAEVNLSGKAFSDSGLIDYIAGEIRDAGIDPHRLGFEITETAAIADMSRAQRFIARLKDLGCRFSLDDFGSGFSSFHYLKHLPIDCLKIDGAYVRGLATSEEDRCLVRGICEMCRGLGVEVLAECVEDEAVLEAVRELGVDYAQGYHIGRPTRISEPGYVERAKT